jgi:hypothetical protein
MTTVVIAAIICLVLLRSRFLSAGGIAIPLLWFRAYGGGRDVFRGGMAKCIVYDGSLGQGGGPTADSDDGEAKRGRCAKCRGRIVRFGAESLRKHCYVRSIRSRRRRDITASYRICWAFMRSRKETKLQKYTRRHAMRWAARLGRSNLALAAACMEFSSAARRNVLSTRVSIECVGRYI